MRKLVAAFVSLIFSATSFSPAYALKVNQPQESSTVRAELAQAGLEETPQLQSADRLLEQAHEADGNPGFRIASLQIGSPHLQAFIGQLNGLGAASTMKHHDGDEAYVVLQGTGWLEISNQRARFKKGDVVWIPPKAPHRVVQEGGGPLRWLGLNTAPFHDLLYPDASHVPLEVAPAELGMHSLQTPQLVTFLTDAMGRTLDIARWWDWSKKPGEANGRPTEFWSATQEDGPTVLVAIDGSGDLNIDGKPVTMSAGDCLELPPSAHVKIRSNVNLIAVRPHGQRASLGDSKALIDRLKQLDIADHLEPIPSGAVARDEMSQRRHRWAQRSWEALLDNVQPSGAIAAAKTPSDYRYDWPRDSWEILLMLIRLNRTLQNPDLDLLIRAHIDFIWHAAQTYGWHPFMQKVNLDHGYSEGIWCVQPDTAGLAVLALCTYAEEMILGRLPPDDSRNPRLAQEEYYRRAGWFADAILRDGWNPNLFVSGWPVSDPWEQVFSDRYLSTELVNVAGLKVISRVARLLGRDSDSWSWRSRAGQWVGDPEEGMQRYWDPKRKYMRAHLNETTDPEGRGRSKPPLDSQVFIGAGGRTAISQALTSVRLSQYIRTFQALDKLAWEFPINQEYGHVVFWSRWEGDFWRDMDVLEEDVQETPWYLTSFWRIEFLIDYAEHLLTDQKGNFPLSETERGWCNGFGIDPNRSLRDVAGSFLQLADRCLDDLLKTAERDVSLSDFDGHALPEQLHEVTGKAMGPSNLSWANAELQALLRRRQLLHLRFYEPSAAAVGLEESSVEYAARVFGLDGML